MSACGCRYWLPKRLLQREDQIFTQLPECNPPASDRSGVPLVCDLRDMAAVQQLLEVGLF